MFNTSNSISMYNCIGCKSDLEKIKEQLELGNKYLTEGKYEEAILAFNKAIEIEPKNIEARIGLAELYNLTEQYQKAESILMEAIDIDSSNLEAYEKLLEIFDRLGKNPNDVINILEEKSSNLTEEELENISASIIPESPKPSIKDGEYNSVKELEFTNIDDGEKVYYTLDGTSPTTEGTEYKNAILLDKKI